MNYKDSTSLDIFLNILFERYRDKVPAVKKISEAMIKSGLVRSQLDIVNDHIAFRTLGVPHLGIDSFEKIFLYHGYQKRDFYYFEGKKLNAYWYSPPSNKYPRIFLSELIVSSLSQASQDIIHKYTNPIMSDPVDLLNLEDGEQIGDFFQHPLWQVPTLKDYKALLLENEYAAWVIFNRYYLNHYTISVHDLMEGYRTLPDFNRFVQSLGIRLNTEGGIIKTSPDGLLSQSSTIAEMQEAVFAEGESMPIAGSYVEFAERKVLPEFEHLDSSIINTSHRREGFETNNADKIFESTYTKQTHGN